jgi:tetratricopeptide (TPR) repeat protein
LPPVSLPDLTTMTESVQAQIREQHAVLLAQLDAPETSTRDLAESYGQLGMILLAADYPAAARTALMNAQTLQRDDVRWPYYLGHLARDDGALPEAAAFFEQARQLHPDDTATLVWLGDVHLAQGAPGLAEPHFARALAIVPSSLSARFGLGRAALMREDHTHAVEYLEAILTLNPEAAAAHYPLGLAYRGLGELERAETHIRLRENESILPADPRMATLDALLESPQAYETRGIQALDRGDFTDAEGQFRRGLELDAANPALRFRLGTTLFMQGDTGGARVAFEEIIRTSPDYPMAHYSLGVLLQDEGDHGAAIDRFTTALRHRPTYPEASLRLAHSLRQRGDAAASLSHYARVLTTDPDIGEARFGQAMALVQLERYREARDRLHEATDAVPGDPMLPHALARLLAAAPDDDVRDGQRALTIVQTLLENQRSLDLGETMAMALAEVGRFGEAAALQRELMSAAAGQELPEVVLRLAGNLRLYEQGAPSRTPWPADAMP